jgi:2-keto-4-pentenoate hydratase/2-oxohepta-3-ene-1,7-dioic acid hydratase in catechol pathway
MEDGTAYGLVEHGFVYRIKGDVFSGDFQKGEPVGGLEAVALLPPCVPSVIISIGANYASRCVENNIPIPDEPGKGDRFYIPAEAITGPGGLIYFPAGETRVEYGGELGIVIRRGGRDIPPDQASDHILGYTIVNNIWAKDPPGSPRPPRERIRAYPTFCPVGPWVVTDIDPTDLAWELRINGVVRQRACTSEMLFKPAEIVAAVSRWHTLQPGDLIQCGTAAGVGCLRPGDVVEVEFEGIGTLRNLVVPMEGLKPLDLVWIDYVGG